MTAQAETKRYTVETYLELELASETRNEYRDGEIYPMTGGRLNTIALVEIFTSL